VLGVARHVNVFPYRVPCSVTLPDMHPTLYSFSKPDGSARAIGSSRWALGLFLNCCKRENSHWLTYIHMHSI
jgi:hypothetical protein